MQDRNHYDFSGRHAVITGGAAGIGLAIAQRLAAGGATVTLWDRDAEALEHATGQFDRERVQTLVVDVASEQSVAGAFPQQEFFIPSNNRQRPLDITGRCGSYGPHVSRSSSRPTGSAVSVDGTARAPGVLRNADRCAELHLPLIKVTGTCSRYQQRC